MMQNDTDREILILFQQNRDTITANLPQVQNKKKNPPQIHTGLFLSSHMIWICTNIKMLNDQGSCSSTKILCEITNGSCSPEIGLQLFQSTQLNWGY